VEIHYSAAVGRSRSWCHAVRKVRLAPFISRGLIVVLSHFPSLSRCGNAVSRQVNLSDHSDHRHEYQKLLADDEPGKSIPVHHLPQLNVVVPTWLPRAS
jgi:hypothetical protein